MAMSDSSIRTSSFNNIDVSVNTTSQILATERGSLLLQSDCGLEMPFQPSQGSESSLVVQSKPDVKISPVRFWGAFSACV